MKRRIIRISALFAAVLMLTSCGSSFTPPQSDVPIKPVGNMYIENHYEGVQPTAEMTEETISSKDGLCVIEKKKSYYDVTIDLEKGSHRDAARAYAEAILLACPEYPEKMEPYLYENIKNAFPEIESDYSGVKKRIDILIGSLDKEYREELEGLAEVFGGERTGFTEDGILSRDEAMLISLVPDALRPTSCSAVSMNGSRTVSGSRLNARILDWDLGSGRELCEAQCVVHFRNGKRSFTSLSLLGMLSVLTAVNDDGVMGAIFDVGTAFNKKNALSDTGTDEESASMVGKKSYTFDVRNCIENCTSACEAGEYLVGQSDKYTFCINVMLTDRYDALCAELVCTDERDGHSLLRDGSTKLCDGVEWDDPEVLCIVNSYAADGNFDQITANENNIFRWKKYNRLFCGGEKISCGRFKELMTCEKQETELFNFRGQNAVQKIIADYSDNSLQAAFAGKEKNPDTPEFIDLGKWERN